MGCEKALKRGDLIECDAYPRGQSESRYWLSRKWDATCPHVLFVLTNPSCATERVDDATVWRCYDIAEANNAGRFEVVNLIAIRDPDSTQVRVRYANSIEDPANDATLLAVTARSNWIVAGWGGFSWAQPRARYVYKTFLAPRSPYLVGQSVKCLGANDDRTRTPKHPARNALVGLLDWHAPAGW